MTVLDTTPSPLTGRERMVTIPLTLRTTPSVFRRFQDDALRRGLSVERWLVEFADAALAEQRARQGIREH